MDLVKVFVGVVLLVFGVVLIVDGVGAVVNGKHLFFPGFQPVFESVVGFGSVVAAVIRLRESRGKSPEAG
jgi:predicted Co/Zn/Cd cation transporter (cation efflux family)